MRIWAWCAILVALRTAGGTAFNFTTLQFSLGTDGFGINNHGDIVGVIFGTHEPIPFLYSGGITPALPVPGIPTGINDAIQVVGSFSNAGPQHAFLYSGGTVTQIDYPGAFQSEAIAINSAGVVYGEWEGSDGTGQEHGYLYQDGTFTDLPLPSHGYWIYQRGGINDAGVIATTLLGIPGSPGVVWDHGTLTQVNYPGADYSEVNGINNRGDLVGIYGAGPTGNPRPASISRAGIRNVRRLLSNAMALKGGTTSIARLPPQQQSGAKSFGRRKWEMLTDRAFSA